MIQYRKPACYILDARLRGHDGSTD